MAAAPAMAEENIASSAIPERSATTESPVLPLLVFGFEFEFAEEETAEEDEAAPPELPAVGLLVLSGIMPRFEILPEEATGGTFIIKGDPML